MKTILDPTFRYVPSHETDITKPGASLAHHIALQALKACAGLDIVDVPYAGAMASW